MTDAERYPPCTFVDYVLDRGITHAASDSDQFVPAAVAMRASPHWTDVKALPGIGVQHRGVVYAWCTTDDCYGYQRGDDLSGEFEAR